MERLILTGATVFDGSTLIDDAAVVVEDGRIADIVTDAGLPAGNRFHLQGGVLTPGLIDLQVNGGGGVMVDGALNVAGIAQICAAHARFGTTSVLPTLITDSATALQAVLTAGTAAVSRVPGFLGLHIEGPFIASTRAGCHPSEYIRQMSEDDLASLIAAKTGLPALMITVAPEIVTPAQIGRMTAAGIVVSLGHSDATYVQTQAAIDAGAIAITHVFNAMSQISAREPGMVGAALTLPVALGLIADGVHVAPETLRIALRLAGERIHLVSDAMAPMGTATDQTMIGGHMVRRRDGALRRDDGTLAGSDQPLVQGLRRMIAMGVAPAKALAMATSRPARLIHTRAGQIAPGLPADLAHFDPDWHLVRVWRAGQALVVDPDQTKSLTA